jgi:hypothetical protein
VHHDPMDGRGWRCDRSQRADAGATEAVGGGILVAVPEDGRRRLERRERFAERRGLRSRANDGRRVLLGFLCSIGRAPFGLIDGLIWPKTGYASID